MTFTLSGEPKSTQHIYKPSCRGRFASVYMTEEGQSIKEAYQWEAKAVWRVPLKEELEVTAVFYFGTHRRCDIDNFNKLWMDALTGIVYEDDSQIARLTLIRSYDKLSPRIEVTVSVLQ